jgi:hypothetical protein
MRPMRVLGACGLVASGLLIVDGGLGSPLRALAGLVMAAANIYCLVRRDP